MTRMYSPLRLAGKYLRYYLTAANGKGHGIHSPFVFDFVTHVLNDDRRYPEYARIESLRRRLLRDPTILGIEDLGAGSAGGASATRSVADIARHAAKSPRLGQLLFRVARHYGPTTMLELGTSLGLSTAYLAAAAAAGPSPTAGPSPSARLYTIEGAPAIAAIAEANLRSLGLDVHTLTGNFDDVLPSLLAAVPPIDLAFVDGNHRLAPTLRYFELLMRHAGRPAVLIFDDIHYSAEMEAAWAAIKADPRVGLTVDLFFLGFVFLRDELKVKQNFVIRF
jgi:predicted O-methyltransferase YrrM